MSSVWDRVEPLLGSVERPARYIDSEWGAIRKVEAEYRVALLYPDVYEIGMANQAIAILYERLNSLDDVAAERVYLPWVDMIEAMRSAKVPLFTLESMTPVDKVDLFGITLPYELTYTNVLEALDLAGLPLRSLNRRDEHPLVVAGGPCVYNPEPVAPFIDALVIGEGEQAIVEIVEVHRRAIGRGASRLEILQDLSRIPGVYVPSHHASPVASDSLRDEGGSDTPSFAVAKRVVRDLNEFRAPVCPVVPYMDVVHARIAIEVLRGCTRGCRFCQAGMVYRPVRERRADAIVRDVMEGLRCTGYDEVALTSLSTTDHSELEEVLRRLHGRLQGTGVAISLPSLRVDVFSSKTARLLASLGRTAGLTLAPEAGTQRLRDVINKNVSDEELIYAVETAFALGWRRIKLYFMIGLPTETDEDIRGIGRLTARVLQAARASARPDQRGAIKIAVSVSTFVPKAHTPFQWEGQISRAEINRRQAILCESMPRKGVELSWHDADVSVLEAAFARGGREISDGIEAAWRAGARFDAWNEHFSLDRWIQAFSSVGLDLEATAQRSYDPHDVLPWSHISSGVSHDYLLREWERAMEGRTTPDCSFEGCTGCGVCGAGGLGVEIVMGGRRRGVR